jgi:hypothetical protein
MAFGEVSDCHPFAHGWRNDFSKNDGGRQEAFIISSLGGVCCIAAAVRRPPTPSSHATVWQRLVV